MPFQKNHKLGAKKILKRTLEKEVIGFKGYEGQKEKLKAIPGWQERLRLFIDELIAESMPEESMPDESMPEESMPDDEN